MKKRLSIALYAVGGLTTACIIGLAMTGWQIGWGPFKSLFKGYGDEVAAIEKKYDAKIHKGEIIFYGASNFRLWKEMENDLSPYPVQNHGFGGSTDKMLVQFADRMLYSYDPKLVFFQTGSNDYVVISGTDEQKIKDCMDYKRKMFDTFHTELPEAKFVVMSGLLLPGRSEYTALTQEINRELEALCAERDYMFFVDASAMTYDGNRFRTELFISDGIHLNHEGQLLWAENYILPQLTALWEE
jgi:lysophospholipase L1-like esterase